MNDQDYEDFMQFPEDYVNGASTAYDNTIKEIEKKLKALDVNFNRDYDFLSIGEARSLLEEVIDCIRLRKIKMYDNTN